MAAIGQSNIEELMELAEISLSDLAARQDIRWALSATKYGKSPARSLYDAGGHRLRHGKHNSFIDPIHEHAVALKAELERLRGYPVGFNEFWLEVGPVYNSQFEKPEVLAMLDVVAAAARKARMPPKMGAGVKTGTRNVIQLAAVVFNRHAEQQAKADEGTPFPAFAARFYELATGKSLDGKGLLRQIREVLRKTEVCKKG